MKTGSAVTSGPRMSGGSRHLAKASFRKLLRDGKHREIAAQAVAIEARTNLLFSFEKMALQGRGQIVCGSPDLCPRSLRFPSWHTRHGAAVHRWCEVVAGLPRRQTRVLTWPVVTVFGFIAAPATHIFLKPTVTRERPQALGVPFEYRSRPNWETYAELLRLARAVRKDLLRSASARYDRHSVISVGAGLG